MFNQKNYLLNCDVCDTRKMKEEDYSCYEKMLINADVVIVSPSSKSILNRLPITMNQDSTIEVADDIDLELKTINGPYEITGTAAVKEHTLLIVNGPLNIHPGTEAIVTKYEKIHANGPVTYPESLEGYLTTLSANGPVSVYPDDCIVLADSFLLDKYFPMRAREDAKYYAKDRVIIQDKSVNLEKLAEKKVQFITRQLIVPEEMVEACIGLFDEKVDFTVIPVDMTLHYGDAVLNEHLPEKCGNSIYVYGNLNIPEDLNMDTLSGSIAKLIVKGNVILKKGQEADFRKLNVQYHQLKFKWEGRTIENKPSARLDKALLENSPNKVLVKNTAAVKLSSEIEPNLILERLVIENCAKVTCSKEQESAVAAIARNVARIGESGDEETPGIMGELKDLLSTKMINADRYIL